LDAYTNFFFDDIDEVESDGKGGRRLGGSTCDDKLSVKQNDTKIPE